MKQIHNFINGEYGTGPRPFDKRSPLDGLAFDACDFDAAIEARS